MSDENKMNLNIEKKLIDELMTKIIEIESEYFKKLPITENEVREIENKIKILIDDTIK